MGTDTHHMDQCNTEKLMVGRWRDGGSRGRQKQQREACMVCCSAGRRGAANGEEKQNACK